MVRAYLRERFRMRIYAPLAVIVAAAASGTSTTLLLFAVDAGFALLLLAQFRAWDDLADRERDARHHPGRVLVRASSVTDVIAVCGGLAVLNICLAVWRDGSGAAVGILSALDAALGVWYLARTRRTAAGDFLLLAKYPAIVLIVAGWRVSTTPLPILSAAASVYLAACLYEAWHDRESPFRPVMHRVAPPGGHS